MPAARPTPQLGGAAYLRLILLGAAIGIPAALVAALFLALVHDLEHWLWHDLPDALDYSSPPWFLVVGLPVVGALIVVAARLFLPGDGGHSPLHGLSASPTPAAPAASVALAGLGSLAFGAVLRPELPVVTLGAAIGVAATWFVRLGERETAVLSTAGGTSAISALFGGPIVAGLLVLESGLPMGAALLPVLLPGLVAAAVGYLIFVGFGDWGGLGTPGLVVPDLPRTRESMPTTSRWRSSSASSER
jgi:H+/Cl- antiporter ClcA